MTETILHRGPDAGGVWEDLEGRCVLGHRRLSIIDTSDAGRQPMSTGDGRWVITFNGEIYNFQDIVSSLNSAGIRLRGRTDTEVLVEAVALWGTEAIPKFDGMFAFAAFDTLSGELIVARDPFGEKPLYYMDLEGGGIAFASELQALEQVPGFDGTVSVDAMAEMLTFQYIGAPRSIYRNVKKLPAGHWMRIGADGNLEIRRYFHFRPGAGGFTDRPLDDLVDELDDILVRSVRRRLIADVPLGAFLSGGVDSSTVCAIVRKALNLPLETFSMGFEGAPDSEHVTARAFAKHIGSDHHEQILMPDASDFLFKIGGLLDEPNGDSSCLPTYLLSQFARQSVTVAVSGDGGDEMFGGYGRYFVTLAEAARHGTAPNSHWKPGPLYYGNLILVGAEQQIDELFGFMPPRFGRHLRRLRAGLNGVDGPLLCAMRNTDTENYLPGAVLPKVDRMSMRHSLEVRTPYLNVEVARFAETLPDSVLVNGKRGKIVLRELAYRYLPRELIDMPKLGFGMPMSDWARQSMLDVSSKMLEGDDSRLRQALGSAAVGRFMTRQRRAGQFSPYQVWAVATLESWFRHHPAKVPDLHEGRPRSRGCISCLNGEKSWLDAYPLGDGVFLVGRDVLGAPFNADVTRSLRIVAAAFGQRLSLDINALLDGDGPLSASVLTAEPLQLVNWGHPISSEDVERLSALKGSTLIFYDPGTANHLFLDQLIKLQSLGVRQLVFPHPHHPEKFRMISLRRLGRRRVVSAIARRLRRGVRLSLQYSGVSKIPGLLRGGAGGLPLVHGYRHAPFALFDGVLKDLQREGPVDPVSLQPGDSVVVFTHALPPGGAERQWTYLAQALTDAGYCVTFVTYQPLVGSNAHYQPILNGDGIPVVDASALSMAEVERIWPQAGAAKLRWSRDRTDQFSRVARITAAFVAAAPKVVFAQLDEPNVLAGLAAHLADVPRVVMSFRNYKPTNFSYLDGDSFLSAYQVLRRSSRVIFSGNHVGANEDYAGWIGIDADRVGFIPNAIDPEMFPEPDEAQIDALRKELRIDRDTPVVLGVFRLANEKNPLAFIEICARVAKEHPAMRAFIAGVGDLRLQVEARIKALGLGATVQLLGRRTDINALMHVSTVLLQSSSVEGMPNVLMEAQLMRLPVVATAAGGTSFAVVDGETASVCPIGDIDGLATAISELLGNPERRREMGEAGFRHVVSNFTKQLMGQRYIDLVTGYDVAPLQDEKSGVTMSLPVTARQ